MSGIVDPLEPITVATFRVTGANRSEYLQGQISNDLTAATSMWTYLLEPDGHVVSLMQIRTAEDAVLIDVPRDLVEAVERRLRRFVLRSDVEIESFSDPDTLKLTATELIDNFLPFGSGVFVGHFVHTYGQQNVNRTVSFSKGCFTGQEIVGRMDARASNSPWRLVQFWANDLPTVDNFLMSSQPQSGGAGIGIAVQDSRQVRGLAVAHRSALEKAESVGVELREA